MSAVNHPVAHQGGYAPSRILIDGIVARNLLSCAFVGNSDPIQITKIYALLLARVGKLAECALREFAREEVNQLAAPLRRVLGNTDSGVPEPWADS